MLVPSRVLQRSPVPTWLLIGFAIFGLVSCGGTDEGGTGSGSPAAKVGESGVLPGDLPQQVRAAQQKAADWLWDQQKDGRWVAQKDPDLGITALATTALLTVPSFDRSRLAQSLAWLAENQQPDGGIYGRESGLGTYVTAASVLAFQAYGDSQYDGVVKKAVGYLQTVQADEGDSIEASSENYGGIGYGSDGVHTNMSTSQWAIEAASAAGLPKDDAFYRKALVFLSRNQNRSESNDMPPRVLDGVSVSVGNDGGGIYRPSESKAGLQKNPDGTAVLRSYGSMTYTLLKSYLLCDLDPKDGRVRAAVDWLAKNFHLDWNPGMEASGENPDARYQGLYYYYLAMARCLAAAETRAVPLPDSLRTWRDQLSRKMLAQQREDGTWVNDRDRWWEGLPVLVTSYGLMVLDAAGPADR